MFFISERMALHMKDNIIGFNEEICCVTDTGTHESAQKQTEESVRAHTHADLDARTTTHNTIPLGNP